MKSRIVCICNFVTEKEISDLLKKGATSPDEIKEMTKAGSACGRCLPEIIALIEKYQLVNKLKIESQGKLNFK